MAQKQRLINIIRVLTAIVAIISLLAFLPRPWFVGMLSHLRPFFVMLLFFGLFGLVLLKDSAGLALAFVALVINYLPMRDVIRDIEPVATHSPLLFAHVNLDRHASSMEEPLAWLNEVNADIVSLQEVTLSNDPAISTGLQDYTQIFSNPQPNSQGSALFLRNGALFEVVESTLISLPDYSQRQMIVVRGIYHDSLNVTILSLHLTRPRNASTSQFQQIELDALREWVLHEQSVGNQVILIGDANLTPWSPPFATFLEESLMNNSQAGFGIKSTWPSQFPQGFQIPIDHVMLSYALIATEWTVGPALGSDHRPILVKVAVIAN